MMQILKKRKVIILAVLVLIIGLGAVCLGIDAGNYKNIDITFDQLVSDTSKIKDFKEENGSLISLSGDPWIEYFTDNKIKTITIDAAYLSDNYTESEVYIMHSDGSFSRYAKTLCVGKNIIKISDDDIACVRFDLLTGEGQEIALNKIILNDNKAFLTYLGNMVKSIYSYMYLIIDFVSYILIPLALAFVVLYGVFNKGKINKNKKKSFAVVGFVAASAAIVYLLLVLFSTNVLYKEKILSFNELKGMTKDFQVDEENQTITSTGYDSWIYVPYANGNSVKTITINLNEWNQAEGDADSELYVFYNSGDFDVIDWGLNVGENTVFIPKYLKGIKAFRFDFTYSTGVRIGLENIEFNRADMLKIAVGNEVSGYVSKIIMWVFLLLASLIGIVLGSKNEADKYSGINKFAAKAGNIIIALLLMLAFILAYKAALLTVVPMCLIGFYLGKYAHIEKYNSRYKAVMYILLILFAVSAGLFVPQLGAVGLLKSTSGKEYVYLFISILCMYAFINLFAILYKGADTKETGYRVGIEKIISMIFEVILIIAMTILLEITAKIFLENIGIKNALWSVVTSKTIWINIILWGVIFYAVRNLFGKILGNICAIAVYLFFYIGNFVKLKYHNTIFLPMDFLQIGDFFGIVFRYVSEVVFVLIVIAIAALGIFLIIKNRKCIFKHKPNLFAAAVSVFLIISFSNMIENNAFIDMGFDVTQTWLVAKDCIKNEGLITYSYTKYRELIKIFPKPDENYSQEYMTEMKNEFDSIGGGQVSELKPNVILIMEESMFDVCNVPDVEFSMDITKNMREYKKADTISPKYGGGTASVEFEALTGMSNYFFLDNIVPYVTYWNSKNVYIPGLAGEFRKNGYGTTVIHPNDGGYYNRNIIYEAMGFDRFIEKKDLDYSPENVADDGWFKDEPLADVIKEEMEKTDEPQFIFTVTVENHMLYESKYDETEVKLQSDKLSENELHQLEQYSQGVYNADQFIKKMIDIVDNADRPTILYIWGDHLPALNAFSTLGFLDDKYNKYSTPLIAYSNYKDIEIGEDYITPNQIAPQILRDAEVEYSSYFDFIYSLREIYPVVQKEFGIDANNEFIKKYEEVQYDVLFGEQYLVNSD